MKRAFILGLAAWLLSACASTPPVTYHYYPTKARSTAVVTLTLGCINEEVVLLGASPELKTTYSADTDITPTMAEQFQVPIERLDSTFADSDIKFDFYDDNRLKGVNVTTTGRGEEIIKSAINLAGSLAAIGAGIKRQGSDNRNDACAVIKKVGGDKPVSLIMQAAVQFPLGNSATAGDKTGCPSADKMTPFEPTPASARIYQEVSSLDIFPLRMCIKTNEMRPVTLPDQDGGSAVTLTLRSAVNVAANIRTERTTEIAVYNFVAPGRDIVTLPIPAAPLFGQQKFTLGLSEAGSITTLGYADSGGTVAALNAAGALAKEAEPPTAKERADEIAQQRRLSICLTQPKDCK